MGEVVLVAPSNHIINDGTNKERRLDDVDVVPLDQLEEGAEEDPAARTSPTDAQVVLVDAELVRVVVDILDRLRKVLGTRWRLVVVLPEVDEEHLGFE